MNLTVVIKTFMRPECCRASVLAWGALLPGVPIVVVDDGGDISPDLSGFANVRHIRTDFDIGISAGRNLGVAAADTRYVFIADDDNAPTAWSDIPAALGCLQNEGLAVLGVGAFWFRKVGRHLRIRGRSRAQGFVRCHATLNHFIGDRDSMPRWDDAIKVGGEHVDFFLECRRIGAAVAGTNALGFYHTKAAALEAPPAYAEHRGRNYMAHVCRKRGLKSIGRWQSRRAKRIARGG